MSVQEELMKMNDLRQNMKNWYVVPLFKLGLIKETTFVTKRGDSMKVRSKNDYYSFFSGKYWGLQKAESLNGRLKLDGNTIVIDGSLKFTCSNEAEIGAALLMLSEVYSGEYDSIDVKGMTVVDVGANIGDSAVYFVTRGARMVHAFEPFPATYRKAKENIALNKMEERIELLNSGVGGKDETVRLPDTFIGTSGMDSVEKSSLKGQEGKEVKIITLETISKMYKQPDLVLKMDCEGCEYESILGSSKETLRCFGSIILEYHRGPASLIGKLKEAGFETSLRRGRVLYAKRVG